MQRPMCGPWDRYILRRHVGVRRATHLLAAFHELLGDQLSSVSAPRAPESLQKHRTPLQNKAPRLVKGWLINCLEEIVPLRGALASSNAGVTGGSVMQTTQPREALIRNMHEPSGCLTAAAATSSFLRCAADG